MDAKLHPNVTLFGIFRGTYDAIYDLRSDSDQWSRDYAGSRDKLSTEYKMRELFMDATLGKWDFRIGKQQVVWGESDGLRLMDIINPLDMRRQFVTRDWRDIRIPQTMVKATYGISTKRDTFLELLWNPGNIERDKIYADTTMSDDYKSPWTLSNSPATVALAPLRGDPSLLIPGLPPGLPPMVAVVQEDTPAWINVNKSEFGARLGGEAGGWFLTLNYWQGFSKTPVVEADLTQLILSWFPGAPSVPFKFEYPRERVIGFTFNKPTGLWVWRGEFATYVDKHYNIIGQGDNWSPYIGVLNNAFVRGDLIAEKTMQASMLGFDYKRFITWLNPEKMFFISGQVFNYHIFDYDEGLQTGPYAQKPREDSYYLSLLVNTEYHMGRICPEVLVVYDAAATGWYIKPRLEFKYGDHWRPEIGALVFYGDQYELPFGEFNNNDEIYFRLKYQF
ncbi:MAG: DUF1302 family protein, partial [Dehalococcoidia bacterium]|nr:DUF1302 family protein [Dehalococcoidia bacterium]